MRSVAPVALLLLGVSTPAFAASTIAVGPASGLIDDGLLGVNAGPSPAGGAGWCPSSTALNFTSQFQSMGVTSVRTHDSSGPMDMNALWDPTTDPTMPINFNWDGTKWATPWTCAGGGPTYNIGFDSNAWYQAVLNGGFEPYLRIGESYQFSPSSLVDFSDSADRAAYGAASLTLVKHFYNNLIGTFGPEYESNLADGYVEVWNEPDNGDFWDYTQYADSDYFALYCAVATRIKAHFPTVKVGGPGVSPTSVIGPNPFLTNFLTYVASHCAESIDFVSFHIYSNNPADFTTGVANVETITSAILPNANLELHLTEYNASQASWGSPAGGRISTAAWIDLQNQQKLTRAHFYRGASPGIFSGAGIIDGLVYETSSGTVASTPAGNAFPLWADMANTYPQLRSATLAGAPSTLHVLVGRDPTSTDYGVLLTNLGTASEDYSLSIGGCAATSMDIDRLDASGAPMSTITVSYPGPVALPAGATHRVRLTC